MKLGVEAATNANDERGKREKKAGRESNQEGGTKATVTCVPSTDSECVVDSRKVQSVNAMRDDQFGAAALQEKAETTLKPTNVVEVTGEVHETREIKLTCVAVANGQKVGTESTQV